MDETDNTNDSVLVGREVTIEEKKSAESIVADDDASTSTRSLKSEIKIVSGESGDKPVDIQVDSSKDEYPPDAMQQFLEKHVQPIQKGVDAAHRMACSS